MKVLELFEKKVVVGISELGDGNMRFFGEGEESEVIHRQQELASAIQARRTARIKTTYSEGRTFTEYEAISSGNIARYEIANPEERIPTADGLATSEGFGMLLPLADCLGIVVYDSRQKVLGLLHAGRQNLEQEGATKFVEFLGREFGCRPEDLQVFFSPHAQKYWIAKLNRTLSGAAEEQLLRAGVKRENIFKSPLDTATDDNYPSNSNGDKKTRFGVIARLALDQKPGLEGS